MTDLLARPDGTAPLEAEAAPASGGDGSRFGRWRDMGSRESACLDP